MARLINVPVVHSSAEMGSAAAGYKAAFISRYGEDKWEARAEEFDAIWRAIAASIDALKLDLRRVKLYQDSLPICDAEAELVAGLAAEGSQNHQLLEALVARGARLVGTEAPALLIEEYRLLNSSDHCEAEALELLNRRDRFIAGRIAETLGENDTALLFMGALHHVPRFLPKWIQVDYLTVRGP